MVFSRHRGRLGGLGEKVDRVLRHRGRLGGLGEKVGGVLDIEADWEGGLGEKVVSAMIKGSAVLKHLFSEPSSVIRHIISSLSF